MRSTRCQFYYSNCLPGETPHLNIGRFRARRSCQRTPRITTLFSGPAKRLEAVQRTRTFVPPTNMSVAVACWWNGHG